MKAIFFLLAFMMLSNSSACAFETIKIPSIERGLFSDATVFLEATVHKPEGSGPFPLLVLNHGTSVGVDGRKTTYVWKRQSKFFVDRGYLVVIPMRKGYGKSEGNIILSDDCSNAHWHQTIDADALDVEKTIEFMKLQPHVRKDKIIVMGQSTGGAVSVAIGAKNIPGVVAVINFAGGRGFTARRTLCDPEGLVDAMGHFGEKSKVPSLWIYTENDKFFPPSISKRMYARFSENAKNAKFILKPAFGDDGHSFFAKADPAQWGQDVDEFLSQIK